MNIMQSVFFSVFRETIPNIDWILAQGSWYDNGKWIDTATWNDGV